MFKIDELFLKVDHTGYTAQEVIEKFSTFRWNDLSTELQQKANMCKERTFKLLDGGLYIVGGAVRDTLLGLEVNDRDFVVTNQTTESMLAMGFQQVGANFPVFLHPITGEEYALARTETKVAPGYHGFTTSTENVSIVEDLRRRDITINSIAKNVLTGEYIDPTGGLDDLKNGVIRCVNKNAFTDDPLRILRILRFAARYRHRGFTIEETTHKKITQAVQSGALNELPYERFVVEIEKVCSDALNHTFNPNNDGLSGAFFWQCVLGYKIEEHSDFFKDVGGRYFIFGFFNTLIKKPSLVDWVELHTNVKLLVTISAACAIAYVAAAGKLTPATKEVFCRFYSDAVPIGMTIYETIAFTDEVVNSQADDEDGAYKMIAEGMVSIITRHRLYHNDSTKIVSAVDNLIKLMNVGEIDSQAGRLSFSDMIATTKHVNADMFNGVTGKGLGEAINAKRVDILKDFLKYKISNA